MIYFCSEVLIRRNELQNRHLHFDRKTATRNAYFDFSVSKKRRPAFILIKKLVSFDKAGFRVNDLKQPTLAFTVQINVGIF